MRSVTKLLHKLASLSPREWVDLLRAQVALLAAQVREIEGVAPVVGERDALDAERRLLANATRVAALLEESAGLLWEGEPSAVGLLAQDGTVYLLIDEEHDPRRDGLTEFRQKAIEHMAHVVTISGTSTEVGGQKAIFVQGFVKK